MCCGCCPSPPPPDRVALAGLHSWDEDNIGNVAEWGADIDSVADVVGLAIAEFIPRQVIHLQQVLAGFPLLRESEAT
jgi:hypothetical protein